MDRVEGWIGEFYLKHTERCPREDWPEEGTEAESSFIDAWRHVFVTKGIEQRFADLASLEMAGDPPPFLDRHLPALVRLSLDNRIREDRNQGVNVDAATAEAATALSRDCIDCGGTGGALRWVHQDILGRVKTFGGHPAPLGYSVVYPCSCPLGKLVAKGLRQQGQAADPLTIDQHPTLRLRPVRWSDRPDCKYRYRPSHWDDEAGMPLGAGEVVTLDGAMASLKSLYASESPRNGGRGRLAPRDPQSPRHEPARGLPDDAVARPDLADAPADDPIIAKERTPATTPKPSEEVHIPEDDLWPF